MHQDRFYFPSTPDSSEVWLAGAEAHHILHVKRAKPGTKITLFNGKGTEYLARITEVFPDKLKVHIEQSEAVDREANIEVTIAFSVPKGKNEAFLIQKCAELGVKALIPLHCERSVVDIRHKSPQKKERWDKIAAEASKQCKRNFITEVEEVSALDGLLKRAGNYDLPLIACTELQASALKPVLNNHPSARTFICLIGPEGGFTRKEIEMAKEAGYIPVTVCHSTLRIETAAIAIPSMLFYAYSDPQTG